MREIEASERIVLSLSTRDLFKAKSRHAKALAALLQIFDGLTFPLEPVKVGDSDQAHWERSFDSPVATN
jgi:hypothetical protein